MSRVRENLTHGSMGGGRNLASVGSVRAMLAPPAYPTLTAGGRLAPTWDLTWRPRPAFQLTSAEAVHSESHQPQTLRTRCVGDSLDQALTVQAPDGRNPAQFPDSELGRGRCSVRPARIKLALLDPQMTRELGIVAAHLFDEPLGVLRRTNVSRPGDQLGSTDQRFGREGDHHARRSQHPFRERCRR